jgi:hypothetical protein
MATIINTVGFDVITAVKMSGMMWVVMLFGLTGMKTVCFHMVSQPRRTSSVIVIYS